ncbi:MAG: hypothetical protein QM820_57615 [Minicystis sp.]
MAQQKNTRKVKTPELLGVLVRCTAKHVLPGLFVIYKVRPKPKEARQSFDMQLAELHLNLAPELGPLPPALPDDKYVLAFADSRGYLEIVGEGDDPWRRFYGQEKASPHAPKINSAGSYDCYFVRHPSVEKARKLVRILNGEEEADLDHMPPLQPQIVELQLETVSEGKQQLVMEVEEKADAYWPRGSANYDGWVLYRDMPHAACAPVTEVVKRLQLHLGTLRYPVGTQEKPYLPRPIKGEKPKKGQPPPPDRYLFDVAVESAAHSFQKDHNAPANALRVIDRDKCHGRIVDKAPPFAAVDDSIRTSALTSWSFLEAEPADAEIQGGMMPVRADAVVDLATGDAIGYWLEKGLRKPKAILVDVDTSENNTGNTVYLRWEVGMRTKAWRELVKAMGCAYGLQSGHTFRDVTSGVNTKERGVASLSLHKTGMAVDLAVKGSEGEIEGLKQEDYSRPVAAWPIVFERKVDERTGSAIRKDHVMHRIAWRLYGHSTVRMDALVSDEGSERTRLVKELADLRRSLRYYYAKRIGYGDAGPKDAEVKKAADSIDEAIGDLQRRLDRDPATFVHGFFRSTLGQWLYDPFNPEGGRQGPIVRADLPLELDYANPAAGTKVTVPNAASFVNMTALARQVEMLRIGAQSSGWQDEAADAEGNLVYKEKQKVPLKGNFGFVVGRLRSVAESRYADCMMFLLTEAATLSFTLDQVDQTFMEQWNEALAKAKAPIGHDSATANVQLALAPADAAVRAFADELGGKFATKKFQCTNGIDLAWGDDFKLSMPAGEILTGAEWAKRIHRLLDEIAHARTARQEKEAKGEAEAKAKQKEKEDAAREAAKKAKKPYVAPKPPKGTKKSEPKSAGDWTLDLHPLFFHAGEELFGLSNQFVVFPGMGTGRALEWWHYQWMGANGRSWISMMEEIGYSREVLGNEAVADLHWRPGVGYPPPEPGTDKKKPSPGWDTSGHSTSTEAVENWPGPLDGSSLFEPKPPPLPPKKATGPAKTAAPAKATGPAKTAAPAKHQATAKAK